MQEYAFTDIMLSSDGRVWCQIRPLKDFGDVEVGEFDSWIEKEENLSQKVLSG